MAHEYAQALFESARGAKDAREASAMVDQLVALLKRDGKVKLLPAILREYERLIIKNEHERPVLSVARKSDAAAAQKAAREHLKNILGNEEASVHVDETLIGGWRVSSKSVLVDRSYKAALLKLYRSIVSA